MLQSAESEELITMANPRYLSIPAAVVKDPEAIEVLRVWATKGDQHFVIQTSVWDDPAAWGILFVDLAKHVARAYQDSTGQEFGAILARVKEGSDAEWEFDTDS